MPIDVRKSYAFPCVPKMISGYAALLESRPSRVGFFFAPSYLDKDSD